MSAEEKFVGFRANPTLVEQIKKRAKSEHRSLAAHMRWLVEQDLWQNNIPILMAAETPESVDLPQDKTKGKYQNAAKTKASARAGSKITKLSENLGCGSSTPTTNHSLKTGSGK
jgi:hypothetical protein